MDSKKAVCVLEAIGSGLKLTNEKDKEQACIIGIKAINTIEQIKEFYKDNKLFDDDISGKVHALVNELN